MLQEMRYYMECLKKPHISHRKIANRMSSRFTTSPAAVKDALLRGGYITLDYVKREGETQKYNHFFKLTGKKLGEDIKKEEAKQIVWDDGTPKSVGNAFDWRNTKSSLYSTREIVQAQQKYNNNTYVNVYSRA